MERMKIQHAGEAALQVEVAGEVVPDVVEVVNLPLQAKQVIQFLQDRHQKVEVGHLRLQKNPKVLHLLLIKRKAGS